MDRLQTGRYYYAALQAYFYWSVVHPVHTLHEVSRSPTLAHDHTQMLQSAVGLSMESDRTAL